MQLCIYRYFYSFNFREYKNKSKELQNSINDLKTACLKPETKNISVLTDLSNVDLVSYIYICIFLIY